MKLSQVLTYLFVYGLALGFMACSSGGSGDKPELPTTWPPITIAPPTTVAPPAQGVWCLSNEGDFGPCLNADWFNANPTCEVGQVTSGRNAKGSCSKVYCKPACLDPQAYMNFIR